MWNIDLKTNDLKREGFSKYQVIVHWLVASFILFQIATGSTMSNDFLALKDGKISVEEVDKNSWYHLVFGLTIFLLMVIRFILRIILGIPKPTKQSSSITIILAKIIHWLFYLVLFLVPISGFVAWNTSNVLIGNLHTASVNGLYVLILIHLIAVVYHQIFLEDNLINRMTSFK